MRRHKSTIILLIQFSTGLLALPVPAQEVSLNLYAQVRAAYVLNLVRLSKWPDSAFADPQDPVVISVVGEDRIFPFLQELLREERMNGRRVMLSQVQYPRPPPNPGEQLPEAFTWALRNSHLVYIAREEQEHLDAIIALTRGHPVLTVSDIIRFTEDGGGMIGLQVRSGNVGLIIHHGRLTESSIAVSSRVLRLASIVDNQ